MLIPLSELAVCFSFSPERGIEVLSHAIHEATIVAAKEEWRGDEHATQHRQNPNDSYR